MKILSRPKGNAEEYGRWSVNPYVGCPNQCEYCYLRKGVWKNTLGSEFQVTKSGIRNWHHAFYLAMAEIEEHYDEIMRDGGLFMSFTTDPMTGPCRAVTFSIIREIGRHHYFCFPLYLTVLTKDAGFVTSYEYNRYLFIENQQKEANQNIALGWTLTGHDEMEPHASSNAERLRAMRKAHADGFRVWASIEPVIDFHSSLVMIKEAVAAGCQHFKIGLLTSNTKVCRNKYDVIECMRFITDVYTITRNKATVYWKQSVRDLLGTAYTAAAIDEILDKPNFVSKDWSIFNEQ